MNNRFCFLVDNTEEPESMGSWGSDTPGQGA
jgi:hypothetical protein